ncbi:hypothetical protein [Halomonas smyrnensis]|uniref:HalD/BesD family halogenase n=1 Tax=Halomonas smyrnensis TaxID=720605 RepID=UPI0002D4F90D|nr:hypothetical protein [Halomonas smyrnensis]
MSSAQQQAKNALIPGIDCIDLEAWPIDRPDSEAYQARIAEIREALNDKGCARIDGFIRPEYHDRLEAEVAGIADKAHFSHGQITPYFNSDEPSLPEDHPRRRFSAFSNAFVAMDWFPEEGLCLGLYRHPAFQRFVTDCLEETQLYTFDDPLAGVVANIMPEGSSLPWHYDTNEFIVSLLTKRPLSGGEFEYCPDLREPGDEHYDDVKDVLDGQRDKVKTLLLELGDLQIFKGRFSMHRVVEGKGERHTAIFGYAKEPGFIGRVERTQQVHGRVLQAHIDAEKNARSDGLDD